jgi:hypothetical protein
MKMKKNNMKLYKGLMACLSLLVLTSCTVNTHQQAAVTAILPPSLTSLPTRGRLPCTDSTTAFLFESPGSIPPDPNSGGRGGDGNVMGTVSPCAIFTITQVAWSTYNREYYVYAETSQAKGWLPVKYIEVIP